MVGYYTLKYRKPLLIGYDPLSAKQKNKIFCFSHKVRKTYLFDNTFKVSTVFLIVPCGYDDSDRPLLFETAIASSNVYMHFYLSATWRDALNTHQNAVDDLKNNAPNG